jgi:hypothetical protein
VENYIGSYRGKNGFSGENQRRVRRTRVALSPNKQRIRNRRRKHSRDDDGENQTLSEMKPEGFHMRDGDQRDSGRGQCRGHGDL